jgi:hypothetical protein
VLEALRPYDNRVADPDPYPDPDWTRIRIRIGSGFNRVSGSGSRRAKMTHQSRKFLLKVHILKCWMASFES